MGGFLADFELEVFVLRRYLYAFKKSWITKKWTKRWPSKCVSRCDFVFLTHSLGFETLSAIPCPEIVFVQISIDSNTSKLTPVTYHSPPTPTHPPHSHTLQLLRENCQLCVYACACVCVSAVRGEGRNTKWQGTQCIRGFTNPREVGNSAEWWLWSDSKLPVILSKYTIESNHVVNVSVESVPKRVNSVASGLVYVRVRCVAGKLQDCLQLVWIQTIPKPLFFEQVSK
jgi:hypothetical protein